ncbi:hypothetical protein BJX65DRAFT_317949 [Aspergillus insuetus]
MLPNAIFAALANPLILGTIIAWYGVLVPYSPIIVFWRYWLYYLNPFTYVTGSLLVFNIFGYQSGAGARTNLHNRLDLSDCRVCIYRLLFWLRDIGIMVIFIVSSSCMGYLMMKFRTKASKKAE